MYAHILRNEKIIRATREGTYVEKYKDVTKMQ